MEEKKRTEERKIGRKGGEGKEVKAVGRRRRHSMVVRGE